MLNMLIKLDEERVLKEKICSLKEMWRLIDEQFAENYTKEIQPDGSAYYVCDTTKKYYTEFFLAVRYLEKQEWFAQYCTKWIWLDNDYNEKMPLDKIDILARRRKDNALFAQYAPQEK